MRACEPARGFLAAMCSVVWLCCSLFLVSCGRCYEVLPHARLRQHQELKRCRLFLSRARLATRSRASRDKPRRGYLHHRLIIAINFRLRRR